MLIADNIHKVRAHIPAHVTLVCVSKFHPVEAIREAYEAGERHFGESRVQELKTKVSQLPTDICWHFIGHLQTNKVRDLLKCRPYLIESVDSLRLLEAINAEAAKMGIIQDILLEVHVAKEETKTGFSPEEILNLKSQIINHKYPNTRVLGLMTLATNTEDEVEIRRCFTEAASLLSSLHSPLSTFSAGMSDDYQIAIECGATSVRIGSAIFGERDYNKSQITNHKCQKIRAVFFDQDGILFDSMPNHAKAWEEVMNSFGLPLTAYEVYLNEGRTGRAVIEEAIEQVNPSTPVDIDAIYHAKSAAFRRLCHGELPPVISGVKEVLEYLHSCGIQCWVVTGSGERSLLDNLEKTFPGIFSGFVTAFDVTHGKPDPEPYLKAWERTGFDKSECAVVENAPLGVRAGKAAGLFTIAVNTGILPDSALAAEHADCIFPNMSELLAWLKAKN